MWSLTGLLLWDSGCRLDELEESSAGTSTWAALPGEPVAYNYGLLSMAYGLRWGIVAHCFRLPGFQGSCSHRTVEHRLRQVPR